MFDVAWSEILVVVVVAIIVVGPKDLPPLLRALGRWMRKARQISDEFRSGLDDMIRDAELDEVRKSIHHVTNFDPRARAEAYIDEAGMFNPAGGPPPVEPQMEVPPTETEPGTEGKQP